MTEHEFKAGLMFMSSIYGKLNDDAYKIYWSVLKKYSADQWQTMIERVILKFRPTSQVPFPLPPDFTEALGLSGENRAHAAVTAVKNAAERWGAWSSVDFGDHALHAIINRFGGWPEVCSWGNAGKWQYNEKKFMEAYEAADSYGESAGPVEGNFEIGNRDKNQACWNQTMKIAYKNAVEPKKIDWLGAEFSNRIENKQKNSKRITNEPEKFSEIANNLGV